MSLNYELADGCVVSGYQRDDVSDRPRSDRPIEHLAGMPPANDPVLITVVCPSICAEIKSQ